MKKIIITYLLLLLLNSGCSGGMGVIVCYRIYMDQVSLNKLILNKLEKFTNLKPPIDWLNEYNKLQTKSVYFRYYPLFFRNENQMLMLNVDDQTLIPEYLEKSNKVFSITDSTTTLLSLDYIVKRNIINNFEYIGYFDLNEMETQFIIRKFEKLFLNKLGVKYKRLLKSHINEK